MRMPVLDEAPIAVDLIARGPASYRGDRVAPDDDAPARPIVAAIDASPGATRVAEAAARLARQSASPLALVYVRAGPPSWLGAPYYQRRLDEEMAVGRDALARAVSAAAREGVEATSEILEGSPARRVRELAEARDARMIVVGSRDRRLKRSVSQKVIRDSRRPVLVAAAGRRRPRSGDGIEPSNRRAAPACRF